MQKFLSQVFPSRLLHVLHDAGAEEGPRINLSADDECLQVSVLRLGKGRTVPPHVHQLRTQGETPVLNITQECWYVARGRLRVRLFDLDRSLLHEAILGQNWILVTFQGGHGLECLDDETLVIECKNGPYIGKDYTSF